MYEAMPDSTVGPSRIVSDRYELVEQLGAGGFGAVWRANDRKLFRIVALKFLHSEREASAEVTERFKQEALVGAHVHPNRVAVFDMGEHQGHAYIVMEYVAGESLARLLDKGPLPGPHAVNMMIQLCDALSELHDHGVIHRDIKPANILLGHDGRPKLTDFGLAKVPSAGLHTMTGTLMGTPAFMSPEMMRGEPADACSDVFAAGCTMYHMLTGRRPFQGEYPAVMFKILNEDPPPIRDFATDVPERLVQIVAKCLAKAAHERYPSARELARDLLDLQGPTTLTPAAITAPLALLAQSPAGPRHRRRALAVAAGTAAVLVVLAGALRTLRSAEPPDSVPGEAEPPPVVPESRAPSVEETSVPTPEPPSPEPDITGVLRIRSDPRNATVTLNDEAWSQKTPTDIGGLALRRHRVQVKLEGYETREFDLRLTAERPVVPMNVTLVPAGRLQIESNQAGITIKIDDEPRPLSSQTGPHDVRLKPGTYKIDVTKEGFHAWSERVTLEAGKITRVTARLVDLPPPVDLSRTYERSELDSQPGAVPAEVLANLKPKGKRKVTVVLSVMIDENGQVHPGPDVRVLDENGRELAGKKRADLETEKKPRRRLIAALREELGRLKLAPAKKGTQNCKSRVDLELKLE